MFTLSNLILFGGILHLGTLIGSAQVPGELNFREELPKLAPLFQHWVWTAGGYIVLNILSFGLLSIFFREDLATGSPLARAVCGYIAVFWGIRLVIQIFLFDAKPYLTHWFLRAGYHGLTAVFTYHTFVYGWAAMRS